MQVGPIQLTSEQAVATILNNIQQDGATRPYLIGYAQRNAIAIQSLIESDTFGPLSDFDDENPAPSPIEQVHILKSFLSNANYANYDVLAITAMLNNFTGNLEQQARSLDNVLLTAQLEKREEWGTTLSASIGIQLKALNTTQILNQMERILDSISEESEDKTSLKTWVAGQRTQIANAPYSHASQSEITYLLLGASQTSKFIRNEINKIINLFQRTKNRINSISNFHLTRTLPVGLLKDGVIFAMNLGLACLFPYRLALTLARETRYQVHRGIQYLSETLLPDPIRPATNLIASIAGFGAFIYLLTYIQPSLGMILDLQLFPETWGWPFIGSVVLGFSVAELGIGLTLGLAKKCYTYLQQRSGNNAVQQAENDPTPEPISTALNPGQKQQLLRLLMPERGNLNNNESMAADKKQKKLDKITAEVTTLMGTTPYLLSNFDKKLLARQENLPEAFNNLEAEIQPFRLAQQP